jgi:hypothetical protein
METIEQNKLESRARRMAARAGLRLEKSRARTWSWNNQRGYKLMRVDINGLWAGERYELTLEQAIEFIETASESA